tara:strand:+ start:6850 stop:7653 length:804 start_codon:yes stop_codon:yes gene_type:complete
MAFGDIVGGLTGNRLLGDLTQAGFDMYNSVQANNEREAVRQQQNEMTRMRLQMEAAERAEQVALRNRLLQQSTNLAEALGNVYEFLGMPYQADPRRITQDYLALRNQNYGDVDRLLTMIGSKGTASAISRGVEGGVMDFEKQQLARKYADVYQKADQSAYDAAINRNKALVDTLNTSRQNTVGEIKDLYGTQFNMEKGLYSNRQGRDPATTLNAMSQDTYKVADSATDMMGKSFANIRERLEKDAYDTTVKNTLARATQNQGPPIFT